jgi:hypothetical protein
MSSDDRREEYYPGTTRAQESPKSLGTSRAASRFGTEGSVVQIHSPRPLLKNQQISGWRVTWVSAHRNRVHHASNDLTRRSPAPIERSIVSTRRSGLMNGGDWMKKGMLKACSECA